MRGCFLDSLLTAVGLRMPARISERCSALPEPGESLGGGGVGFTGALRHEYLVGQGEAHPVTTALLCPKRAPVPGAQLPYLWALDLSAPKSTQAPLPLSAFPFPVCQEG